MHSNKWVKNLTKMQSTIEIVTVFSVVPNSQSAQLSIEQMDVQIKNVER